MKNKIYLLKYESENLGDDIQTVAVMDILDELSINYSFVYRDLISGYFFNPLYDNYIVFNGWFTNGYGFEDYYSSSEDDKKDIKPNFPPKGNFKPIIFSFHISEWGGPGNREVHYKFLDQESSDFYKLFNVGCRDSHTLNIMNKLGVDAYFSGCITLSLNKDKYKNLFSSQENILFVDVPNNKYNDLSEKINYLYKGIPIKELTHKISSSDKSTDERFNLARKHLSAFCNAKLVVTSRLHVLLPCLAFGTPVIFIADDTDADNSRIVDYIKLSNTILYSEIKGANINDYLISKYDGKLSKEVYNNFKKIIEQLK